MSLLINEVSETKTKHHGTSSLIKEIVTEAKLFVFLKYKRHHYSTFFVFMRLYYNTLVLNLDDYHKWTFRGMQVCN